MKKVCIVVTIPATMTNFVVAFAEHLYKEKNYDVTLICAEDEKFRDELPQYLRYVPISMKRGVNLSGFRAIKQFRRVFRKEKFDIVQYATPNASFYASIAAKAENVPIRVYGQWGMRYVGFSGLKRKVFKFLEKIVCKKSTHIFSVSNMNKEFAIKEKLYPIEKVQVVGNGGTIGVDMKRYDLSKKIEWRDKVREKYKISANTFIFGYAGRLAEDKGCKELLTAFKELCEQSDLDIKLLLIGPKEENTGIDNDLWVWTKNSNKVIMTGHIKNSDMREYYASLDVLVHPTYREGFGMVIQEAGALSVPVITTKIPGASEVMVDGESCLLVEPRDKDSLKEAMYRVIRDKDMVHNLGEMAYKRTKMLYDRPIMLKYQTEAYEKLLETEKDD